MNSRWQPDEDVTPTTKDVEVMALTLEGRHGVYAEHVATFFSELNAHNGDASRSWAWAAVCERVRKRTSERLDGR